MHDIPDAFLYAGSSLNIEWLFRSFLNSTESSLHCTLALSFTSTCSSLFPHKLCSKAKSRFRVISKRSIFYQLHRNMEFIWFTSHLNIYFRRVHSRFYADVELIFRINQITCKRNIFSSWPGKIIVNRFLRHSNYHEIINRFGWGGRSGFSLLFYPRIIFLVCCDSLSSSPVCWGKRKKFSVNSTNQTTRRHSQTSTDFFFLLLGVVCKYESGEGKQIGDFGDADDDDERGKSSDEEPKLRVREKFWGEISRFVLIFWWEISAQVDRF